MKAIDFSQPGGFPLTQDQLNYLQEAYTEALEALAAVGGTGPIVISGCGISSAFVSGTTYEYFITAGWIWYEGQMVRVPPMGPLLVDTSSQSLYIQLTATSTPLTYNNGSTPNVVKDITGALVAMATGTADSSTLFLASELQPYGREDAETNIVVNTASGFGTITGNIYYRKNFLNNTLQLRGALVAATPGDFPALPAVSTLVLATLPVGYRPNVQGASFRTINVLGSLMTDASGGTFDSLGGILGQNGQLIIYWRNMGSGSEVAVFNVIVPLD